MKLAAIGAIAGALLGWWLGTNHIEGKWAKADNAALREQTRLYDEAIKDNRKLEDSNALALLRLSVSEEESRRVKDELQAEIDKEPLVRAIVLDSIPDGQCFVPDVERHFRLWNCGISNSCQTLPDAVQADHSNGSLRGSDIVAGMDGTR